MKIGETILKLREEKKMSQEEFAEYFHVTRQTISNWEKEKSFPDLQTLVKISDAAGVSVDSMLRDNFIMVQQIDKKVKHLKLFKIGTAVIAAIILVVISYFGIQTVKQNNITHSMESSLKELGFEKNGNNYCLEDVDFRYDIYLFDKPAIWKWNQELDSSEKFVVGTYTQNDSDLLETKKVEITIRKTEQFTTLNISKGDYTVDGVSPQISEYTLDKNGEIKNPEKMDEEDYKIYSALQGEIKEAVEKMNGIYSKLYK